MDGASPLKTPRFGANFAWAAAGWHGCFKNTRKRDAAASPRPADVGTNDKCNDFCELACYRLAIAPFKRCRAEEQPVRPPLANPTAAERIANTPLVKIWLFPVTPAFTMGSGIFFVVERTTDIARLLQGSASFSGRNGEGNILRTEI